MECCYINKGIISEITAIVSYAIISFIGGLLMLILTFVSYHIVLVILALFLFAYFIFYLCVIIDIKKTTTLYKVLINDDLIVVLMKNRKIEVKYDDIIELKRKRNYYLLHFSLPYVEVRCGLSSPIYLLATRRLIDKLSTIQNEHFIFCLKRYNNYDGPILKRDKIVKY